jgi:hypothetical protein
MLDIMSASYGASDVLDKVKNLVAIGANKFKAVPFLLGVEEGKGRKFKCVYRYKGIEAELEVEEGQEVEIPKKLNDRLGIFYTNNNHEKTINKTLANLASIRQANPNFDVIVCSQKDIPDCPFKVILSLFKESSIANLIVQVLQALYEAKKLNQYKYVSFLEHDVMYPPGYFEYDDFDTDILHNRSYRGVCEKGFQNFGGQFPILSQMTVKIDKAIAYFEICWAKTIRAEHVDSVEPSGSVTWFYANAPAVHINRPSLTEHHNFFTINYLDESESYWGHYSSLWTGE